MKLALITTAPSVRSGIGDYTRSWLGEFAKLAQVEVFVERAKAGETICGLPTRSSDELDPRKFDQVVYQLGNEIAHAFMTPLVKRIGGTVVLHDWVLFDQAIAANPQLARGGLAGHLAALREGGIRQAVIYARNRREHRSPAAIQAAIPREGTLASGWHAPEPNGRWTTHMAWFRVPARDVRAVRAAITTEPQRGVRLFGERSTRWRSVTSDEFLATSDRRSTQLTIEFDGADAPLVALTTYPVGALVRAGLQPSDEQKRLGDTRLLGSFVHSLEYRVGDAWIAIDLGQPASAPTYPLSLDRDRFRLPFNRSIVRGADSFVVHSEFVESKIVAERSAATPIGVVHHGAEPHWRETDRREMRAKLGLGESFRGGFLMTSFGHVQAHKRVGPMLEALALARRERDDLHLALVGSLDPAHFDARAIVARLALEGCVHFTDYVTQNEARDWIHAGDLAVQLRGPSTGGSSGGVFQSLALGRGVIATDQDEQSELPNTCVLKVAPGSSEVRELAKLFVDLRDDSARRTALELGARAFVREECSWKKSAERYFANLERFPRPRGASTT